MDFCVITFARLVRKYLVIKFLAIGRRIREGPIRLLDFICHVIVTFKTMCNERALERERVMSGRCHHTPKIAPTLALAEIHMRAFIFVKSMIVT